MHCKTKVQRAQRVALQRPASIVTLPELADRKRAELAVARRCERQRSGRQSATASSIVSRRKQFIVFVNSTFTVALSGGMSSKYLPAACTAASALHPITPKLSCLGASTATALSHAKWHATLNFPRQPPPGIPHRDWSNAAALLQNRS